jgi:hypothetical protein
MGFVDSLGLGHGNTSDERVNERLDGGIILEGGIQACFDRTERRGQGRDGPGEDR